MNEDSVTQFLERPLTAIVSTVAADGSPHSVPVWYRFDGERLYIWTDTGRRWLQNVLRDPRVSVAVSEHEPPFGAVLLRGTADVATGEEWIGAEARRITARYVPAREVDGYVERWSELDTIVTLVPERTVSWGRGY